jgi:ribonuclease PH
MIKAEQIPDEVVEAFVDAYYAKDMTRKAVIAAALAAWPGADTIGAVGLMKPSLILPLTKEGE